MNDSDPAKSYAALRDETAAMLNLNADSASLVENLQVSLVAILRMEVDTLEGQVLAGDAADLKRLEIALGMLRQLLPEKSLVASPAAAPETRFGSSHRAKLKELIEKTLLAAVIESPDEIERNRTPRGALRRFNTLVFQFTKAVADGRELLTAEREMVRHAAAIMLRHEQLQAAVVRGEPIDPDELIRLSSEGRRVLRSIRAGAKQESPSPLPWSPLRSRINAASKPEVAK